MGEEDEVLLPATVVSPVQQQQQSSSSSTLQVSPTRQTSNSNCADRQEPIGIISHSSAVPCTTNTTSVTTSCSTSSSSLTSSSSFVPRRTRHRVDAGEPRGCFNSFYTSNQHQQHSSSTSSSGGPFSRFLYSQSHQQHQHSSGGSGSGFLLGADNFHPGIPKLYSGHHHGIPNHRSASSHQHHHPHHHQQQQAGVSPVVAPPTPPIAPPPPGIPPQILPLTPHHLLFYENQQREQQLKMLGELHQQQLLRDMLQKKIAEAATPRTTNNNININNNNNTMGLAKNVSSKSGYEEDCEEIARAREEIEKCNKSGIPGAGTTSSSAVGVNSNVSSSSSVTDQPVTNNNNSRINGCKKRKLYQPQKSDGPSGLTSGTLAAAAAAPGLGAGPSTKVEGASVHSEDEEEEDTLVDDDYDGTASVGGDHDREREDEHQREGEEDVEMGTDEGFDKKEDVELGLGQRQHQHGGSSNGDGGNGSGSGGEDAGDNKRPRVITENHHSSSQHHQQQQQFQRVLRSQHKNSLLHKHHNNNNDSELLMTEISERKEKYTGGNGNGNGGGLVLPQFKRSSPNFMQHQERQQLAPITRHLLQQQQVENNATRSSPTKQQQHGHLGTSIPPLPPAQLQQLQQWKDSLKTTLATHLGEVIDSHFAQFVQQQEAIQRFALQHQIHAAAAAAAVAASSGAPGLPSQHQQQIHDTNAMLNGNVPNGPPSRSMAKSPGAPPFPIGAANYLKQQQGHGHPPTSVPPGQHHHQNLFTSALTGLYQHSRTNGLYLEDMDTDSPLSLVVTPQKKKRSKVTDTRLTPRAVSRLLESGHRDFDRPTYISEDLSSPPPPPVVLPNLPPNNLMDNPRANNQLFSPGSAAAAVAMYNAALLNGIQQQQQHRESQQQHHHHQQQQQQQRNVESPIPGTQLPVAAVRDNGKRVNKDIDDYVQQLRELNNNSAGSADSGETIGSFDMREGSSYGGASYSSTTPITGTSSTLTPMHLRKAKLMFFWVRYPSSAVLKMYFPDIRFNKNNTAQLVKWFSNFREFYYIQMEKYSRQALAEGIKSSDEIVVTTDHELYRVLNLHYNRNNHIEVPANFRYVVEQTLKEFFKSVQLGKDSEQSWKKAIYKIIARLDDPVPEYFKSSNFLEQLE